MTFTGTISVVIRVRNEGPALRRVLGALKAQHVIPLEIIVVDNESSDDSRAIAVEFGVKILDISRADFTYGRALNLGIRRAAGDFICILSAHSLPIGPSFLQNALAPFEDTNVAAVRCLSVTSRAELENWTKFSALEWPVEIETVISRAPVNCASMIRRSVWEQIPYDETLAAVEDKFWAFQVLQSGYRIRNSSAVYLYVKDFSFGEKVRKLNSDRLEFFRKTGKQWQEPPVSFARLIYNAFYNIPRRAFRSAIYEAALYACLRTIPYQLKRKQKAV